MTDDELWQAYNDEGKPTGSLTLDQVAGGALHGAAHVWIWHCDGKQIRVFLQKRASSVVTWPGFLDAVGGHIDIGEQPLQTAVREANEEIGAGIAPADLQLLFVHRHRLVAPPSGIIENEIQWVYGMQLDPRRHLHLLDSEVDSTRWVDLEDLTRKAQNPIKSGLVPHDHAYFSELFESIKRMRSI